MIVQAAERRLGPLRGDDGDNVDVMEEQQRFLVRPRGEARVDALPLRIVADELRVDAVLDQHLLEEARARGFVPRRVRGVEAKVLAEEILGLALDDVDGGARGAAALERGRQQGEQHERGESDLHCGRSISAEC